MYRKIGQSEDGQEGDDFRFDQMLYPPIYRADHVVLFGIGHTDPDSFINILVTATKNTLAEK